MSEPTQDPHAAARLLRARVQDGPLHLPVTGESMAGTIADGSTVEIVAAPEPRVGEVWATVDPEGTLIVHRVRETAPGHVVLRGTGNPADDDPVPRELLIGRVLSTISDRGGRRHFGRVDRRRAAIDFGLRRRLRPLRRRLRNVVSRG